MSGHLRKEIVTLEEMDKELLDKLKKAGIERILLCVQRGEALRSCVLDVSLEIAQKWGEKFDIPVFYHTQLLGLAMGFTPEEMGIQFNVVDSEPFLNQILKE